MSSELIVLLRVLAILACLSYLGGIAYACVISWKEHPDVTLMPSFVSGTVISIGAILATNLGSLLGLPKANPDFWKFWNPLRVFSEGTLESFQVVACYIYLLGLIAAAIVWAKKKFTDDMTKIVPLLPQLTQTLIGVIAGALLVSLKPK